LSLARLRRRRTHQIGGCGQRLQRGAAWLQDAAMKLEPYEYKDPAALITDVAGRVPLTEDTAYLVLVANPATEQRIVVLQRYDAPALLDDYDEARNEIYERVQALPIPDGGRPRHSVMTVLVRRGLCVFGPQDLPWFQAWRYSNHLRPVFGSEFILVTEHGWCDLMTGSGGSRPALVEQPMPA
jgi:hypothetical protein